MEYKAVSRIETLPFSSPPMYATVIPCRNIETKFSNSSLAKQAISYYTKRNYDWSTGLCRTAGWSMSEMSLFKYDPSRLIYDMIWDSQSELAQAVQRDEITLEEMYRRINW